jgi:hypothetical protein
LTVSTVPEIEASNVVSVTAIIVNGAEADPAVKDPWIKYIPELFVTVVLGGIPSPSNVCPVVRVVPAAKVTILRVLEPVPDVIYPPNTAAFVPAVETAVIPTDSAGLPFGSGGDPTVW